MIGDEGRQQFCGKELPFHHRILTLLKHHQGTEVEQFQNSSLKASVLCLPKS
jgi:hypothetical protein